MSNTPVDRGEILRQMALAEKEKAQNRVPKIVLVAKIADFLNSDESYLDNVQEWMPTYPTSQVKSRLRTIIKENGFDGLVWPVSVDGNVSLTKLV